MLHAANLLVCLVLLCLRVHKAQTSLESQHCDGATARCVPAEEDDEEGALLQTMLESAKSDRRVGHTVQHRTAGAEGVSRVSTGGGSPSQNKTERTLAENADNVSLAPVNSQTPHLRWFQSPLLMLSLSRQARYLHSQLYGLVACCFLFVMMVIAVSYYQKKAAVKELGDIPEVACCPQPSEPPSPAPRLAKCGMSFVIPHVRLSSCRAAFLNFDVPAWPVVWPFQVVLRRPNGRVPWAMLEITSDAITAAGLPPILSCKRVGHVTLDDERLTEIGVYDGANAMVATIKPDAASTCFRVHRESCSDLDVYVELIDANPRVTVGKQGREVALATSIGPSTHKAMALGNEEYLQLDVQPEGQSPEAAFLLACVLAVLAFRSPNKVDHLDADM